MTMSRSFCHFLINLTISAEEPKIPPHKLAQENKILRSVARQDTSGPLAWPPEKAASSYGYIFSVQYSAWIQ